MNARSLRTAAGSAAALLCACAMLMSHATPARGISIDADQAVASAQFVLKPAIHGNRMVYVRSESGLHSVWLEDLDKHRVRRLSDPDVSADAPDISGDLVVWQERRHGGSVIVLCDLKTLEKRQLTKGSRDCAPSIWGDDVVWTRESGFDAVLMYMDLQTGYQGALIKVRNGTTASLCDGRVAHDSGGNLYLLDLRTAEQKVIVDSPHRIEFPDLDGDTVVYARWGGSLGEIGALDLVTGESATIVSDGYCSYAPAIDGDTLAWESYCVPSGSQVHVGRLPTGSPFAAGDGSGAWTMLASAVTLLGRLAAHVGSFQAAAIVGLLG